MSAELGQINTNTVVLEEADKGVANGVAELDANGEIPLDQFPNKTIVLQLGSSQAINTISATTINFSSILKNDITGASVSGTGVVTLPIGEYKASYIINGAMQSGGARANVATAVVKGAGGGGGIVQGSVAYSYARNIGNPNGSNSCPNFQGGLMNYTAVGTFTVVSLRVGEAGPYNSVLGQCILVIEKIR